MHSKTALVAIIATISGGLGSSAIALDIDTDDIINISRSSRTCRVPIVLPSAGAGTCNFDAANGASSNPFFWIDPNQACKLDFALPGLPNLNLGGLMGDLCDTIQEYGQTALDDALKSITDRLEGSERDGSVGGVMEGVFQNQDEIQNTFCPVYDGAGKLVSWRCAPVDRAENEIGQTDEDYEAEYGDPVVDGQECPSGYTASQKLDGSWFCRQNGQQFEVVAPTLPYCEDLESRFDKVTGYVIECIQNKPKEQSQEQSVESHVAPTGQTAPAASETGSKDGWANWDSSKKDGW